MAVLGAVCRSGDVAASERLCVHVCVLCTCVSIYTHTHTAHVSATAAS